VVANELQHLSAPRVTFCLIRADVVRQQRCIFGFVLGRPRLFVCPAVGAPMVVGDAFFQQRAQLAA
jgi:hypothetical protein